MINQKDSFAVGEFYVKTESQFFPNIRLIFYVFQCIKRKGNKVTFELVGRYQKRYLEYEWEKLDIPKKKIYNKTILTSGGEKEGGEYETVYIYIPQDELEVQLYGWKKGEIK